MWLFLGEDKDTSHSVSCDTPVDQTLGGFQIKHVKKEEPGDDEYLCKTTRSYRPSVFNLPFNHKDQIPQYRYMMVWFK